VPLSNFVPRGFGFVHHSIAILDHQVPNPNITIRNFFIAVRPPTRTAIGSVRVGTLGVLGGSCAHGAVTRRPPISLYKMVPRTGDYTYDVRAWDSSILQGPFSIAPCRTLIFRFATSTSLHRPRCAGGRILLSRTRSTWLRRALVKGDTAEPCTDRVWGRGGAAAAGAARRRETAGSPWRCRGASRRRRRR
jgi:hypothetical protein